MERNRNGYRPAAHVSELFKLLGSEVRCEILTRLVQGRSDVGEIAADLDLDTKTISKHLRLLERCGLVAYEVEGNHHRYSLGWCVRVVAIDDHLHLYIRTRSEKWVLFPAGAARAAARMPDPTVTVLSWRDLIPGAPTSGPAAPPRRD